MAHPNFLKRPPEDELPTVDQPPPVNPNFFSSEAGMGLTVGAGVCNDGALHGTDRADHWGNSAEFHPGSLGSLPELFLLSFPFLFPPLFDRPLGVSLRSLDRVSLNRILGWWA